MQKNILLTGASGFIGFHTAVHLKNMGFNVHTPVRERSISKVKIGKLEAEGISVIPGSFYDDNTLDKLSRHEYFSIIHLAAIRGEVKEQKSNYYDININATKKLLEFAKSKSIHRFLYCSTVGVLGTIPHPQPASINNTPNPDNSYHQSKWEAEELVRKYHSDNLKTIILRPTITYGVGDDGFMLKLVNLVSRKKFINCTKTILIHLLNVETFAKLVVNILKYDNFNGNTYIVADEQPVKLQELVDVIHQDIYESKYPKYLVLPSFIYNSTALCLGLLGNKGLKTSIQLISKDWIYDISSTIENLNYKPSSTLNALKPIIKDYINALHG